MSSIKYCWEDLQLGLLRSSWELFNQNGEKVLQMEGYGMFRRRTPATPEEIARLEASLKDSG